MIVYALVEEWEEKGLEMERVVNIYSSATEAVKKALERRAESIRLEIEDECDPLYYRIDEYEVIE